MGTRSWFRVPLLLRSCTPAFLCSCAPAFPRSWQFSNATLITRSCDEIKNIFARSILLYTIVCTAISILFLFLLCVHSSADRGVDRQRWFVQGELLARALVQRQGEGEREMSEGFSRPTPNPPLPTPHTLSTHTYHTLSADTLITHSHHTLDITH